MPTERMPTSESAPSLMGSMLLAAMAGGLGWGIRGQYGHETGAMIAGVLVGLVLVLIYCPRSRSLAGARAAALFTLGISLGGSMTYAQTVGLTHDVELVGHWAALGWGLLGLFLKGGIWIAWAAAFLGVGLGGKRYRTVDLSLLLIALCFLWFLGVHLLNEPFDPAQRVLPRLYFSDDWRWEPQGELTPRREIWGGLLVSLVAFVLYARIAKGDRLVLRLACWGFVAGGLGFSLGQSVQAVHAWNDEWFRTTAYVKELEPHMNWWNVMETTFGAIFGAILTVGLWLNRHLIDVPDIDSTFQVNEPELDSNTEWTLAMVHVGAVLAWNFLSFPPYDRFADQALTMVLIPTVSLMVGHWWPYLITLPIVLVPIAGKTVRELVYNTTDISVWVGWGTYLVLPVVVSVASAWWLFRRRTQQPAARFAAVALVVNTWLYFALNLAFFRYPWPWQPWTFRTPNLLIFIVCAVGLTVGAIYYGRSVSWSASDSDEASG
jgi:hypothetical protein